MLEDKKPQLSWGIIISFLIIPLIVSIVSTIHVINFFSLSNHYSLAVTLAIAFELGALSALAGLIVMDKISKNIVWLIFIALTMYQMMGNTYFAYDYITTKMVTQPDLIRNWTELFGLGDDTIFVKRIIAIISGSILPLISLGFLHLLIDYIQNYHLDSKEEVKEIESDQKISEITTSEVTNIAPGKVKGEWGMLFNDDSEISQSNEVMEPENKDEMHLREYDNSILRIVEEKPATSEQVNFAKFMDHKRQQINEMREPNLELLGLFYNYGAIKEGEELPNYEEFTNNMIDKYKNEIKTINAFLTLCNYLKICELSGTQKIAVKNYEEAKEIMSNYLKV